MCEPCNGVYMFFYDSTESSYCKSAGRLAGIFWQLEILVFQDKKIMF